MFKWLTEKCKESNTFAWGLTAIGITLMTIITLI